MHCTFINAFCHYMVSMIVKRVKSLNLCSIKNLLKIAEILNPKQLL